jgi:hypothetical protein
MSRNRQLAQCLPEPRGHRVILQPFRNSEGPIWGLVKRQLQSTDAAYHRWSCSPPKGHATSSTALSRCLGMAQGEPSPEFGPATLTRLTPTPVAPDSKGRGEWNEGRILICRLGSGCSRVIGSEYRFVGRFCRTDADAPPQEAARRGGRRASSSGSARWASGRSRHCPTSHDRTK